MVYGCGMFRRHAHWIIALFLVTFVISACVVRTRPSRPPPQRGRPVYVVPDKGHDHDKHKHRKHKHKHKKHRHH
jgi:hypothetical protein